MPTENTRSLEVIAISGVVLGPELVSLAIISKAHYREPSFKKLDSLLTNNYMTYSNMKETKYFY